MLSQIKKHLSSDLLKACYRLENQTNPTFGHCYVASEALYHLSGGKASGLLIKRARDDRGITHWWLEYKEEKVLDPTAEQYYISGRTPPYAKGVGAGFLTRNPSKRALILMDRIRHHLQ